MEGRIIVLKDEKYSPILIYVETNAPKEEIERAINYKDDYLLENHNFTKNGKNEFEMVKEYLENKFYYFEEVKEIEEYYW